MVWPFSKQPDLTAIDEVSTYTAFQINEQLRRINSQIAPERASALADLNNINGLVSGYALGVASGELREKWKMENRIEKLLADKVQLAMKSLGYDIHVWKHAEFQSHAFVVGVKVAGQETTNRYYNHQLWEDSERRYNLLFEIINILSDPHRIGHGVQIAELLYSYGVRISHQLIYQAVDQLRGSSQ